MSVKRLLEWADDEGGLHSLWLKYGGSFNEVVVEFGGDFTEDEAALVQQLGQAYALAQNYEDQLYALDAEEQMLELEFDCE